MPRFRFLDWMRGLAILVMIQCHAFNSLTRPDLRSGSAYIASQFVGGMAAPLFLFMAGVTFGFQMDSLERREPRLMHRWLIALRRSGYIFGIAILFRLFCFMGSLPNPDWPDLLKVDILNCMGVAMAALSPAVLFPGRGRIRFAAAAAVVIAAAAPLVRQIPWHSAPPLLHDYLVPEAGAGRFPFFPFASYLAFGVLAGTAVKRASERVETVVQWSVWIGLALVFGGQWLASLGFSPYRNSSFWVDSPLLIFIRTGVSLLMLSGSYFWTEYCAPSGWSWIIVLGRNSLMVYWVHIMLVYGWVTSKLQQRLTILQTAASTAAVVGLMVILSVVWPALRSGIYETSRRYRSARKSPPILSPGG
jgi:uncharacterized membrane protein